MKPKTNTSAATTNSPANSKPAGSKPFGNLKTSTEPVSGNLKKLIDGATPKDPLTGKPPVSKGSAPAKSTTTHPNRRYI